MALDLNMAPGGDIASGALEHLPIPMLVVDDQQRIVVVNDAAVSFLGYNEQQHHLSKTLLQGKTLAEAGIHQLPDIDSSSRVSVSSGSTSTGVTDNLDRIRSLFDPLMHEQTGRKSVPVALYPVDRHQLGSSDSGAEDVPSGTPIKYVQMTRTSSWRANNQTYTAVIFSSCPSGSISSSITSHTITPSGRRTSSKDLTVAGSEVPDMPTRNRSPALSSPGLSGSWIFPSRQKMAAGTEHKVEVLKEALYDAISVPVWGVLKDGSAMYMNAGKLGISCAIS
jgi:hypothetical protein